jgi:thioester reductase-like protein
MAAIFLTEFSSSTGSLLVEHLLERYPPDVPIYCLVQIALRRQAEKRLAEIERAHPVFNGRIRLVEGAITLPDLGLGSGYGRINTSITEVYHLATVDERRQERDLSTKVNLIGVQNVLSFAERCPHFTRFHHVSSSLVSGHYPGVFSETELDKGQSFRNHHEETLFLAEMEVQRSCQGGMPVTVYRPGRVTGDSRTGAIRKEDALFDILTWLLSHSTIDVPVLTGNPYRNRVNVVPRDYVAAAVSYLSGIQNSIDKVYHLVDSNPIRLDDFARILGEITGRRLIQIWAPRFLARPFLQIDPEVLIYLHHPTLYPSQNTLSDLEGSGVVCPPFERYAAKLVDYILSHTEIGR